MMNKDCNVFVLGVCRCACSCLMLTRYQAREFFLFCIYESAVPDCFVSFGLCDLYARIGKQGRFVSNQILPLPLFQDKNNVPAAVNQPSPRNN
jgi:hypothetical protein